MYKRISVYVIKIIKLKSHQILCLNLVSVILFFIFLTFGFNTYSSGTDHKRPNILFAISDDQGYPHASAYGCKFVNTPGFDKISEKGILFKNVFCAVPQCSPNRASILTGRYLWQNEEAGTHASLFPAHLKVFTDSFIDAGYTMGATGKTWGPGIIDTVNRPKNPTLFGKYYSANSESDYWNQFQKFLSEREKGKPFFFWFGSNDPHRPYQEGSGLAGGKKSENVEIPPYLPDTYEIRSDFLDYAIRIERFDSNLVKMIELLEETGELENTLIIVTSDNGMPFPRAKGNAYEAGVKVPMAVCWGDKIKKGSVVENLISHIDLAPTLLDAASLPGYNEIEGKSFLDMLLHPDSDRKEPLNDAIFYGRERATSARPNNFGYPVRTIRTKRYQLVWNMKPDRSPAGDELDENEAIAEKNEIIERKKRDAEGIDYFKLAFGLRPEFELYDMQNDPYGMVNLAENHKYKLVCDSLFASLKNQLIKNGDPRLVGNGDIWESYPRFMRIKKFAGEHPAWKGVYNDYFLQPGQRIPKYLFDSEDYKLFFEEMKIDKETYIKTLQSKGVVIY